MPAGGSLRLVARPFHAANELGPLELGPLCHGSPVSPLARVTARPCHRSPVSPLARVTAPIGLACPSFDARLAELANNYQTGMRFAQKRAECLA
jgi:hypothetical protein